MKSAGNVYATIEEAAAAGKEWADKFGSTNIYQDADGYWPDSAASFTIFSFREGSGTFELMAKLLRGGEIVPHEKKLRPGDLDFWQGRVSKVYGVGDPQYGHYDTETIQRGVRLPSFKKQCREEGYTIVHEDAARRTCTARKVTT